MFRARSTKDIVAEAVKNLADRTSISHFGPGSKALALVEALAQVVGSAQNSISRALLQSFLSEATGLDLDIIAESVGLQRLPAEPVRVSAEDLTFRFYVKNQTFGNINGGQGIVIPAGTQIRSSNTNLSVYFVIRDSLVLPADQSTFYFGADQMGVSGGIEIGPGVLTRHNFSGYTDAALQSLLVTNDNGLASRPRESDANLRFRIKYAISANLGGSELALKLAALKVPGVADVRFLTNRSGAGMVDMVVFGINQMVGPGLLRQVREAVVGVTTAGIRVNVIAPRLVGISLRTTLTFTSSTSLGTRNSIRQAAVTAARDYITGLEPGMIFLPGSLLQVVQGVSPEIISVGSSGRSFNELLLWKANVSSSNRYARIMESGYLIQDDEELVVEPSLDHPIEILEA